jgi:NAD(P) transhydrogenase subunit alpha
MHNRIAIANLKGMRMRIAVVKETKAFENRVAATPETVKKYINLGGAVTVQQGAGLAAGIEDNAYTEAGATIASTRLETIKDADIVLAVQLGTGDQTDSGEADIAGLKPGAWLIGLMAPYARAQALKTYAQAGITTVSLELVPRITRAQSMDVLSSQSNLAGYRAVIEASSEFGRAFPMMMTAAGTVAPAKVLVLGAGVAGLQAIATAKRLGAIVSAFDVRAAAKEQVESLGATFVQVESAENAETAGGYAKEMSEEYKKRQAEKIHETVKKNDIVISTALIPGKPAPVLITPEMVADMKYGSVIVDLAVEAGGNCPLSEMGKVVEKHGVKIIGHANFPSRIAIDASALFSRNMLNYLGLILDKTEKVIKVDWNDEIIKATVLTHNSKIVHPNFGGEQV